MRHKYAVLIVCIVVLVILEKENNIISRSVQLHIYSIKLPSSVIRMKKN